MNNSETGLHEFHSSQWLTVREFARVMGRNERQIRRWVNDGTLAEFGFPLICYDHGRFHRIYFISIIPLS